MRAYSYRLLSPFLGLVQIAELPRARALSLDGNTWAIQYSMGEEAYFRNRRPVADLSLNYALVGTIEYGVLKTHALHPFLDPGDVRAAVDCLYETVTRACLPFPAADRYEYWLLDRAEQRPLALLYSSIDAHDMARTPRPSWIAMPAAQLQIRSPEAGARSYVPPVNYRLEKFVEERAGTKPRAAWFDRGSPAAPIDFPHCLLREDWEDAECQQLCDLYIRRLAPRLLMMHGLPQPVRERLERAARDYVFDVERFHRLYPEVVDERLLTAARVEARLRRAMR